MLLLTAHWACNNDTANVCFAMAIFIDHVLVSQAAGCCVPLFAKYIAHIACTQWGYGLFITDCNGRY
jgi:hypothetical protein